MDKRSFKLAFVSDTSLRITFDNQVNRSQVYHLSRQIVELTPSGIVNAIPAYQSILIEYLPHKLEEQALVAMLEKDIPGFLDSSNTTNSSEHIEIPVLYSSETALDLGSYQAVGISLERLIELHTSTRFEVAAIGFAPGFAFLDGLPQALQLPRKDSPRTHVPKGSVAIAGSKTAIYPDDSPGGWNIIGRTPLTLFSTSEATLPYKIGDIVTFKSISKAEFLALGGEL